MACHDVFSRTNANTQFLSQDHAGTGISCFQVIGWREPGEAGKPADETGLVKIGVTSGIFHYCAGFEPAPGRLFGDLATKRQIA